MCIRDRSNSVTTFSASPGSSDTLRTNAPTRDVSSRGSMSSNASAVPTIIFPFPFSSTRKTLRSLTRISDRTVELSSPAALPGTTASTSATTFTPGEEAERGGSIRITMRSSVPLYMTRRLSLIHIFGQSSSTLSGGESQRVKLASFLTKDSAQVGVMFIFDEPTTGLHFHDINKLLAAFNALIERGHTIVIVEHNMDVIK